MTMTKQLLLSLLLLLLPFSIATAAIEEIDGIAAVVDDDVITRSELQRRLQDLLKQLQEKRAQLPPLTILKQQLLERMIIESLQLAQAKQLGINVEDEELNRIIERIAGENKLSLLQFREELQRQGIPFATFREDIRREVVISRLRSNRINNSIEVTPQEIDNLLETQRRNQSRNEELHLQHILIALPGDASSEQIAEAQQEANQLYEQLRGGADFTNLAISHSDAPQALEGGDIGWRRLAQLPTTLANAISELQGGGFGKPVRNSSGFHLFKLLEKRGDERHMVRQVDARHILIRTNDLISDSEAKARLERLRERILSGEEFAELARAHSDDGSARSGGDLGWADPSIYVESFRDTINRSQIGEVSHPFKSQFGWHILQVRQWRSHDNTEAHERNQAYEALRERKIEEETENWLRRLRDEAYVDTRLEN
ncbi:MAG: peptidylprolyl isomerase [Chromatiales bacterium]|nr:peptidylprolyl isomerase [Chromatiales bacterium]